jgi:hypothetical protein
MILNSIQNNGVYVIELTSLRTQLSILLQKYFFCLICFSTFITDIAALHFLAVEHTDDIITFSAQDFRTNATTDMAFDQFYLTRFFHHNSTKLNL